METRLRKLNTSQLTEICRKMKCSSGSKNEMIKNLLRPLGKKYKMEKITDPRLKGKIMSFLPDDDAANFLVNRKNKLELQGDIDKRARKHMKKIRKWNNLIANNRFKEELERTNFKDIGVIFDLSRKGFINLLVSVDTLQLYFYIERQLKRAVKNENIEILKNILKDQNQILRTIALEDDKRRGEFASVQDIDKNIQIFVSSLLRQLIDQGSDNLEIYKILLEHGADLNQELWGWGEEGQSLLDYLIQSKVDKNVIETLKGYGAKRSK